MMIFFFFLIGVLTSLGTLAYEYWSYVIPMPELWSSLWTMDWDVLSLSLMVLPIAFVVWLISWFYPRSWLSAIALILTTFPAAVGIYAEFPPTLLIVSVIGALVAWDMASFNERLAQAASDDNVPVLVRRHLLWVSGFVLFSVALGIGALNWRLSLTFEWVAVLVILGIWGVAQLIKWLRRGGAE